MARSACNFPTMSFIVLPPIPLPGFPSLPSFITLPEFAWPACPLD